MYSLVYFILSENRSADLLSGSKYFQKMIPQLIYPHTVSLYLPDRNHQKINTDKFKYFWCCSLWQTFHFRVIRIAASVTGCASSSRVRVTESDCGFVLEDEHTRSREKKEISLGRTELPCRGQNQHWMTSQDELTRFPRRLSAAKDKLSYLNNSNNQSSQLFGLIDDFHIDKSHYITHKYINERVFSQYNYSHLIFFFALHKHT